MASPRQAHPRHPPKKIRLSPAGEEQKKERRSIARASPLYPSNKTIELNPVQRGEPRTGYWNEPIVRLFKSFATPNHSKDEFL